MTASAATSRAQTEPLAALVAAVAVVAVVGLYASVHTAAIPSTHTPPPAATLDRVRATIAPAGVAAPDALDEYTPPAGLRVNATLRTTTATWTRGPPAPENAAAAAEPVAVRASPGDVVPGRLRVVVWS